MLREHERIAALRAGLPAHRAAHPAEGQQASPAPQHRTRDDSGLHAAAALRASRDRQLEIAGVGSRHGATLDARWGAGQPRPACLSRVRHLRVRSNAGG
jgi:hypothetical protein